MGEDRGIRKEEREKKKDECIFGFSKVTVGDSCPVGPYVKPVGPWADPTLGLRRWSLIRKVDA